MKYTLLPVNETLRIALTSRNFECIISSNLITMGTKDSMEEEYDEPKTGADIETEKYMELYEQEVWDEAIRTYNVMLFGLLRYF